MRISKPPEVRKQEIIDTAMKLFYKKGYEATSMADIAKEMNVVQGLCYRYFASKQELFETAMDQYVRECCSAFVAAIHDRSRTLDERMNLMCKLTQNQDSISKYHDFYHKEGNEALHEQLTLNICKYLVPHIKEELQVLCDKGEIELENADITASFIMYGQIGIMQDNSMDIKDRVDYMRNIIRQILYGEII
ncbi:TetR/AcrR family transcriptional regulator [Clostridium oryzae]|uniref:Biofilm operon icaADBC HTH-type negative transcriptional regulator IcaR n=1 Tax=Clostridium oryzae TaxID=1450648 RepID=A0A1V4IVU2_9CLOT|nr:TetR/AcrR family transcriptional regulator [Clostridium oryzae]OPJ64152.1 biofilm operon icaADBC HTH-type negative transcriptional regulator IcaR [Clostridium oryzae]